jgi:hypothetical protein
MEAWSHSFQLVRWQQRSWHKRIILEGDVLRSFASLIKANPGRENPASADGSPDFQNDRPNLLEEGGTEPGASCQSQKLQDEKEGQSCEQENKAA